tara:strand:+ start:838 stop:996 length:159 start_codon:yes stop_codon:yes gene_type:complete
MHIEYDIDEIQEMIERDLKLRGLTVAVPIELELSEKENVVYVTLETIKKEKS